MGNREEILFRFKKNLSMMPILLVLFIINELFENFRVAELNPETSETFYLIPIEMVSYPNVY